MVILLVHGGRESWDVVCGLGVLVWWVFDRGRTWSDGGLVVGPMFVVTALAATEAILFVGWARSIWRGHPLRGVYLGLACVATRAAIVVVMRLTFTHR